jgi:hypothetical protein
MDVLADIFDTIQLKGSFYFRTHFSPPWGTTVPRHRHAARFHYVVAGNVWIRAEGADAIHLSQGDFVMIPAGASHVLADRPTTDAPPLETVLESAGYRGDALLTVGQGDASAPTQLICGHFAFSEGADHAILRALPPFIKISAEQRQKRTWFAEVLDLLVRQVFNDEPGAIAAVMRFSEILLSKRSGSRAIIPPNSSVCWRVFRMCASVGRLRSFTRSLPIHGRLTNSPAKWVCRAPVSQISSRN